MLIQLGTNLHNDYADFVMGADTHQRVGQARATQKGWLTPQQTSAASTLLLGVALAIGLQLLQDEWNDGILWFIILTSIFNAVAYTGGPFPLGYIGLGRVSIAYSGLGDVFCLLYFGLVATLTIPYLCVRKDLTYVETLQQLQPCLGAALAVGFLATAIIVVNNLRDRHTDVLAHKRTVAVRFGGTFCRMEYATLLLLSYMIVILEFVKYKNVWLLLPLLSMPLAVSQLQAVWTKDGADLNPHVGGTARLQLAYCILLSVGLRRGVHQ
jgi:1,4-dihydroxy-2-naphthoate octaprenyltransferase